MARDSPKPVVSEFDLYVLARQLFRDRGYLGTPLPPRNGLLTERRAKNLISEATFDPQGYYSDSAPATARLWRDPDFLSILFVIREADAIEVMMAADPFCYLSHRSALEWHGLARSGREELQFTTPHRPEWQRRNIESMSARLGFDLFDVGVEDLPIRSVRAQPRNKVRRRGIVRHETRFPSVPVEIGSVRVASVGETFRETLTNPAACGGMSEIIPIWRDYARVHLDAIVAAIQGSRDKIVRVRAGYLLEEALRIEDPRIEQWLGEAQRGSSRKLDPGAPYENRFSERWMLSINVPDPALPVATKPR